MQGQKTTNRYCRNTTFIQPLIIAVTTFADVIKVLKKAKKLKRLYQVNDKMELLQASLNGQMKYQFVKASQNARAFLCMKYLVCMPN